jgi:predicted peroxiredoxin
MMKKKVLLVITHSTDDPDRANAAIALAASLINEDADLALFFIFEGVKMVRKGVAGTIEGRNLTPVRELFPMILEAGLPMYACSACLKTHEIPEAEMVAGVQIVAAPTLAAEIMQRETVTF